MNRRFDACLVSLMMAAISGAVFAQQAGEVVPLQRGVSVQMPVTRNAVAVPNADTQDAVVVALTADGTTYLRADPLPTPALADRVRSILSTRNEKTLYIKADARVPYARLVEVIDARSVLAGAVDARELDAERAHRGAAGHRLLLLGAHQRSVRTRRASGGAGGERALSRWLSPWSSL